MEKYGTGGTAGEGKPSIPEIRQCVERYSETEEDGVEPYPMARA